MGQRHAKNLKIRTRLFLSEAGLRGPHESPPDNSVAPRNVYYQMARVSRLWTHRADSGDIGFRQAGEVAATERRPAISLTGGARNRDPPDTLSIKSLIERAIPDGELVSLTVESEGYRKLSDSVAAGEFSIEAIIRKQTGEKK